MVVSVRCEATLELGRKLTKELEVDESVDILGRWMAHYIAELIVDAETAGADERSAKMQACSEAILNLWKYRHELPSGKRPFEDFEPILRALESLDPDDDAPRYFRSLKAVDNTTDESDEVMLLLKIIDELDYSAKLLIRYCLTKAAEAAIDKSAKWVALAEEAGADEGVETFVIRVIDEENRILKASDPDENARKLLQDRIDRLDEFIEMATALSSALQQQLNKSK